MTKITDLHTHTTASDGQYRPSELVKLAKGRGIEVLGVTDHDTIAGLEEAITAGYEAGVQVIRGIEFSAKGHHNFHILGYHFAENAPELHQLCDKLRQGRDERKYQIIEFLRRQGVEIALEEVEEAAGGEIIARPHFAQVLVRRGYVSSNREAFDRYLDSPEYRRQVKRFKAEARTCIEVIHAAGGRVSLAHPYQMGLGDGELEELVKQLAGWGLDAIECDYPKYTAQQREFYYSLTQRYGLQRTGGSDFHGEQVKPDVVLSALELDLSWLLGG